MWDLNHKESWVQKNWFFWTVVLEKTLESLLDCKEIQPVHPKWNQSWIFIGRTDAKAQTPILGAPDVKNGLVGKDPDPGKDWRQEEKGPTEDEMVGWYQRLDGHEFGQALGIGNGQGSLACCSPWNHRVKQDWETELNTGIELQVPDRPVGVKVTPLTVISQGLTWLYPGSSFHLCFQLLKEASFYLCLINGFVKGTYAEFYQLLFQYTLRWSEISLL